MGKVAFLVAVIVATVLARLPAGFVDIAVASLTNGQVRVAEAAGSVWRGTGIIATTTGGRPALAWKPVSWHITWTGPDAPSLTIVEQGRSVAVLNLTLRGPRLSALDTDAPARAFTHAIRHPLAQADLKGNIRLASDGIACSWKRECDGTLAVTWQGAAAGILPGRRFGDYLLSLVFSNGNTAMQLTTLRGEPGISGNGRAGPDGALVFDGLIEGDPEFTDRIPYLAGSNARLTGKPGTVAIHFP